MSVTISSSSINTIALLDSIRRFVAEIELRADAVEIMNVEGAMWDITLQNELRRHKAPPVPCFRVRRIDP